MSTLTLSRTALACTAAALALPATGLAASATPLPGYTQFTGCPDTPDTVFVCQFAKISAGSFKFGNVTVPVTSPLTLTGGITNDLPGKIVYTSAGGLKASALKVPGGLTGLTGISEQLLNVITLGANTVYAVPQLVGTASISADGQGFRLPIAVKLKNPFLAASCSLGTAANPIVLNVTIGTTTPPPPTQPITGTEANDVTFDEATQIISSNNATYVDNAFAVPGASGCGNYIGSLNVGFINGIVNARVGLPAAAGKNAATLADTDIQAVSPTLVYGN